MSRGVLYMLTGDKHAVHLAVAVWALRKHYDGPVAIAAGCERAETVARAIELDRRSGTVEVIRWDAPTRGSSGGRTGIQYANKCEMLRLSPFDQTIFMDADTAVVHPFDELWPREEEVRLTQFAQWKSNEPPVRGRLDKWRDVAAKEVAVQWSYGYPALNTGVIGFCRHAQAFFDAWREMTHRKLSFICDEIAAQLIFAYHPHCILDERWNCSPIYSWARHAPDRDSADPRIWHFHGQKAVKAPTGRHIWWPLYEEAELVSFADLAAWTPQGNKRLAKYLRDPSTFGPNWRPSDAEQRSG